MTNTAKPTLNKGCTVKLWDRANFRYFVSDEAVDVYHETNLTPRQLLERVRELEAVRDDLNAGIYQLYDYAVNRGNDDDFSLQISILIRQLAEFSFAKHGEGV